MFNTERTLTDAIYHCITALWMYIVFEFAINYL